MKPNKERLLRLMDEIEQFQQNGKVEVQISEGGITHIFFTKKII